MVVQLSRMRRILADEWFTWVSRRVITMDLRNSIVVQGLAHPAWRGRQTTLTLQSFTDDGAPHLGLFHPWISGSICVLVFYSKDTGMEFFLAFGTTIRYYYSNWSTLHRRTTDPNREPSPALRCHLPDCAPSVVQSTIRSPSGTPTQACRLLDSVHRPEHTVCESRAGLHAPGLQSVGSHIRQLGARCNYHSQGRRHYVPPCRHSPPSKRHQPLQVGNKRLRAAELPPCFWEDL